MAELNKAYYIATPTFTCTIK